MSRVLLVAIAAAVALFAVGTGSDLFGMLRGGASVRTVPAEGGSLLRAVALETALSGLPEGESKRCASRPTGSTRASSSTVASGSCGSPTAGG